MVADPIISLPDFPSSWSAYAHYSSSVADSDFSFQEDDECSITSSSFASNSTSSSSESPTINIDRQNDYCYVEQELTKSLRTAPLIPGRLTRLTDILEDEITMSGRPVPSSTDAQVQLGKITAWSVMNGIGVYL
jgi:hypothetical protein